MGNVFFGVAIGIFVLVIGVMVIPFFTDDITAMRTNLECSNVSISDGVKLTCLYTDLTIPYFIWFFISLALGIFAGINK
jgi:hypothetical protein